MTPIKKPSSKVVTKVRAKRATAVKKTAKKVTKKPEQEAPIVSDERLKIKRSYLYAVGRRKSAVARVRFFTKGSGTFVVNGKPMAEYFPMPILQSMVKRPLEVTGLAFGELSVKVAGGGVHSQAEAVRHGLSRVLLVLSPEVRIPLKRAGLLTRDARVKERKKYGLKRARRAPQWQKR